MSHPTPRYTLPLSEARLAAIHHVARRAQAAALAAAFRVGITALRRLFADKPSAVIGNRAASPHG